MSEVNQVQEALKALAKAGFKPADFQKAIKELKGQGVLKSGKGKAPSDDPVRNAIKDLILNSKIKFTVKENDTDVVKEMSVIDAINSNLNGGHSYLVTLGDKFQLNFIEKRKKVSKKKKDAAKEGTDESKKVEDTFKEANVS